jgi:hypothetical protein
MLDQVHCMFDADNPNGYQVELGFACAHGRQSKTALKATTWKEVFTFYETFESKEDISKMGFNTFYRYTKTIERDFHLTRPKTDACDVCERIRVKLIDAGLSEEERKIIEEELEDHQEATRTQRHGLKEFVKMWGKKEGALLVGDGNAWAAAADRLLDVYDEDGVEEKVIRDLLPNCRASLQCEDYAGNFPFPWYGAISPGVDYYLSKLHMYCFFVCNLTTGRNKAYCYDQRVMGKGADGLCSLRLYDELQNYIAHRDAGTLASRPTVQVVVRDNCVGQNKSKYVTSFSILMTLLFYERTVTHFLGKGHSHMLPDVKTAHVKSMLVGKQVYSTVDIVDHFNKLDSVDAEFFDTRDEEKIWPLWAGSEQLFKGIEIEPIPAIGEGGYTKNGFFEFGGGRVSMRPTYVSSEATYEHEAIPLGRFEEARVLAMTFLFGEGKALATVTMADVQLPRCSSRPLPAKQAASIASKKCHIPEEYHHWYPETMILKEGDEVVEGVGLVGSEEGVDVQGKKKPASKKAKTKTAEIVSGVAASTTPKPVK